MRVLERREVLGGACVTEELWPGYKVSTAAYLCSLMQERIIRELDLPRYGYRVYAKDPAFFTPFPDGRHLTMWQDQKRTCEEIAKFSRKDAEAYPQVRRIRRAPLAICGAHAAAHSAEFHAKPDGAISRCSGSSAWNCCACRKTSASGQARIFTQSVAEFLEPWFESEEIKVTLATDGVIGTNGGPRSPGTAYVLLHHVMGGVDGHRGLWGFVRGGMGAISRSHRRRGARGGRGNFHRRASGPHLDEGKPRGPARSRSGAREWRGNSRAKRLFPALTPSAHFWDWSARRHLPPEFASAVREHRHARLLDEN